MWKIVHNALLLALNNRLQLVVLQHESQASDLRIFWEIIEKKSTSPWIFFFCFQNMINKSFDNYSTDIFLTAGE